MAARYLPSTVHARPDSKRYLLMEAAKAYELCGNNTAATACRKLVHQVDTGIANTNNGAVTAS